MHVLYYINIILVKLNNISCLAEGEDEDYKGTIELLWIRARYFIMTQIMVTLNYLVLALNLFNFGRRKLGVYSRYARIHSE